MKFKVMEIYIIAAIAKHRVIGCQNRLPWHLPADLKHFKELTLGQTVVMGRKTYESIGRPLPKRENIVITQQADYEALGCKVFSSLVQVVKEYSEKEKLFIIGGAALYEQALPLASYLLLTFIDAEVDGDTFFPKINFHNWQETFREECSVDENNSFNYKFVNYKRCFPLAMEGA